MFDLSRNRLTFFDTLIGFFISLTLLSVQNAFGSLEAVELELVPSDIKQSCNRSFFRSSTAGDEVVFVTPHVIAGRSPIFGSDPEVHLDTTEKPGEYLLSIGLYFPRDAGDDTNAYEVRDAQANFCNFDSVKYYLGLDLNESSERYLVAPMALGGAIVEKKHHKEVKIVHLPLTSIEVSIPGVNTKAHLIGRVFSKDNTENVDILEYNDRSYTAEFRINEDQLTYINTRFARDEGLQLNVKYSFQSRKKDGSVEVFFDSSEVSTKFQAEVSGKPPYMDRSSIKAALQSAVSKSDIRIREKGGSSSAGNEARKKIIDGILGKLEFSAKPKDLKPAEFDSSKGDSKLVSVKVVAEYISSKATQNFSYSRVTAPENTSAVVPVRVTSSPKDPLEKEIVIKDLFNNGVQYPKLLKAGQKVHLTPKYSYLAIRQWGEKETPLTRSQLDDLGIFNLYPELREPGWKIEHEVSQTGKLFAVAKFEESWCFFCHSESYRFIRRQRFPIGIRRITFHNYDLKNLDEVEKTPVVVSFSRLGGGKYYTLKELFEDQYSDYWDVKIHMGSVILTAKVDLGHMKFIDDFKYRKRAIRPSKKDKMRIENLDVYYENKSDDNVPYEEEPVTEPKREWNYRKFGDVITDEAFMDFYEGNIEEDKGKTFEGNVGKIIKDRVDTYAIKRYRAVQMGIIGPYYPDDKEDAAHAQELQETQNQFVVPDEL